MPLLCIFLQICNMDGWDPTCNNIVFHIFDDPGHGKKFHSMFPPGVKGGDKYWDAPPSGRRPPEEEIAEAFTMLKQNNVIK